MYSQLITKFLPHSWAAQYWFLHGDLGFFSLEGIFTPQDFLFLDQSNLYYTSGKETIYDIQAFLTRLDAKGVQWLICVPDNYFIWELFSNYYFNQLKCKGLNPKRPLVFITNYPVKF